MKHKLLFILLNIVFTATFCWVNNCNNDLKKQMKSFSQKQKQLNKLLKENNNLKFVWDVKDLNIEKFLTENLNVNILKHDMPSEKVNGFKRPDVAFSEGYISGYLWYADCYNALKVLADQDLPLWVKTLSIDRDIYENYNLQFSMTYIIGKWQGD